CAPPGTPRSPSRPPENSTRPPARVASGVRPGGAAASSSPEDVTGTVEFRAVRNGTRAAAAPVFPMTVAELDSDEGRAEDDTGPIEVIVPRDDQLDSTT
ncbi:hypothetical protein, partial [Nonomuraea sp. SBT364]|uniref:hypothetical protein n=1 Tax=Nonomuraea sp. SBT364 TaxID=1580530 RepID=UPI001E5F045D